MVVKKYLCAAPRPEVWDERGKALLKSLGGDEKKREQVLRDTLLKLREMQNTQHEKRTGPGRRSNAEHAIAFYEYLLGERDDKDEVDDEEDGDDDGDDDDEQEEEDDDDNNNSDDEKEDDDDDNNGDGSSSSSSSPSSGDDGDPGTIDSMDTQEFLNQHNDECDVCNLGGVLLCCSTCSLVFHKECIRPVLSSLPKQDEEWSCPHCIIHGVRNYKRHSKAWKAAAAGVRLMGRMRRNQTQQQQQNDSTEPLLTEQKRQQQRQQEEEDVKPEESNDPTSGDDSMLRATASEKEETTPEIIASQAKDDNIEKGRPRRSGAAERAKKSPRVDVPDTSHQSEQLIDSRKADSDSGLDIQEKQNNDVNTAGVGDEPSSDPGVPPSTAVESDSKKRNRALLKLTDSWAGTENLMETLVVKGRRPRRQPNLFNPQICADSRWQSDERTYSEKSRDDNTDSDTGGRVSRSDDVDVGQIDKRRQRKMKKESSDKGPDGDTDDKDVDDDDDDNTPLRKRKQTDEKTEDNEKKSRFVWCNFCQDDPKIPICVFCACRICFGKHDKEQLLLCDSCDEEYHLVCLGLSAVPTTKKWFCPSCDSRKSSTKLSTRRSSSTSLPNPRTPKTNGGDSKSESSIVSKTSSKRPSSGRKSKSSSTPSSNPSPLSGTEDKKLPAKNAFTFTSLPSPKRRGRPPKNKDFIEEIVSPKKRGRPPKSASLSPKRGRPPARNQSDTKRKAESASPPRKRGRPPKVIINVDEDGKKRGPGRPTNASRPTSTASVDSSLSVVTFSHETKDEETLGPPEPVKVSRISGRTVKRYSFHDEIEEGEQHLRSSKPSDQLEPTVAVPTQPQPSRNKTTPEGEPRKKQKTDIMHETQQSLTVDTARSSPADSIAPEELDLKEEKDEDMTDDIAPVRMKTVVQPPAPAMGAPPVVPILEPVIPEVVATTPEESEKHTVAATDIKPMAEDGPVDHPSDAIPHLDVKDEKLPAATSSLPPQVTADTTLPPRVIVEEAVDVPKVTVKPVPAQTQQQQQEQQSAPTKRPSTAVTSRTTTTTSTPVLTMGHPTLNRPLLDPKKLEAAIKALPDKPEEVRTGPTKIPRRKPGARECIQISRRFGNKVIPEKYMKILLDYCQRGKVEHLIRMRERLDCHSRYLESQLAGLEALVLKNGESDVVVPIIPEQAEPTKKQNGSGPPTTAATPFVETSRKEITETATKNVDAMVPPPPASVVNASKVDPVLAASKLSPPPSSDTTLAGGPSLSNSAGKTMPVATPPTQS